MSTPDLDLDLDRLERLHREAVNLRGSIYRLGPLSVGHHNAMAQFHAEVEDAFPALLALAREAQKGAKP